MDTHEAQKPNGLTAEKPAGRQRRPRGRSSVWKAMAWYLVAGLAAVAVISLVGAWLLRRAGEAEAIRDAEDQMRLAVEDSIEPALGDGVLGGDAQALAALDRVVQERVLSDASIVRVKLWDRSGRIVYSDEYRLIGKRYESAAEEVTRLEGRRVDAEVTDPDKPENRYERGFGRLLEVYMPIRTPGGELLRYEAYYRSSFVSARGDRIFREFAPVMLGALIVLALVQLPLAWRLARRVQWGRQEREQLLGRAIEASDAERRRIARDLHDGVVQDLAAVSYSLSAAADRAPTPFDAELRTAAAETRGGIRQLRTLLVEIYPPELHRAGLAAALADLLTGAEARGLETDLKVDTVVELAREPEALLFRVAQEGVRNVVKHAQASRVTVTVEQEDARVRLLVEDDGRGFDPDLVGGERHFGLRMLADVVREAGGDLVVDSAPGEGSRLSVQVAA